MDARKTVNRWLVGAALVAVVASGACDDELAAPTTIVGFGAIEGLVFFDVSEDGFFDPVAGDVAVAGVNIEIRDRGTSRTFGSGTSGVDGRFLIGNLPGGTHDMVIDTLSVPDGISICQNPLQVTVNPDETRFAEVRGRPGCLITIGAVKELAIGEFAITRGIVTSFPGQIEANFVYIEEPTGGLFLFAPGLMGQGIAVGDQIEVGGTTALFSGQFQLTGTVSLRVHTVAVEVPVPLLTTTAAIAASGSNPTDDLQNRFVRLEGVMITGAFGSTGNSQNGTIDDGSGAITIRVDDGVVADRDSNVTLFPVGTCYNINGFAANFNGSGQIFPRSVADMESIPCT